jgi:glycosyltransferase involved in cell wall biosynthesis
MRDIVLGSGIDAAKVHLIPIGVELDLFPLRDDTSRAAVRSELGLPLDAPTIGSMQKDGVGWGEGNEPKLIKGPDVFVEVASRLAARIPDLHVLLTGPARGYVERGLTHAGIPYVHAYPKSYADVGRLYAALDAYVVTSRQEGGPKAVLESMAAGVPLVTTRVGQAMDLVEHEVNGYMVESEDVEGLVHFAERALRAPDSQLAARGRATAEANTYEAQRPLWRALLDGFVSF